MFVSVTMDVQDEGNSSQGGSPARLDVSTLTEQEVQTLKQVLGIIDSSTQGVDLSSLTEEQIGLLKEKLGVSAIETELEGLSNLLAQV